MQLGIEGRQVSRQASVICGGKKIEANEMRNINTNGKEWQTEKNKHKWKKMKGRET